MTESIKNNNEEEFRAEQSGKLVEFLARSGVYKYFQDILSGKEEVPDFEKFEDFITRINGIARDIPISERQFDGVNVGLSGMIEDVVVPKHEDKEALLKYAYDSIPETDKGDIKYLLPAVINAVHLFNDGNGRTSRIMHLLLRGYSSEEEFLQEAKKALGKDGRLDSLDINPGLIGFELEREVLKYHGWIFDKKNPEGKLGLIEEGFGYDVRKFDENNNLEKTAKTFFDLDDAHYKLTAVHMLLGDDGIKPLLQEYGSGENKRTAISMRKLIDSLGVEEWEKLQNIFFQLKKEQVQVLVDAFKKPEEHKTIRNDAEKPIKDIFIEDIQKRENFI